MAEEDLNLFRENWKHEIKINQQNRVEKSKNNQGCVKKNLGNKTLTQSSNIECEEYKDCKSTDSYLPGNILNVSENFQIISKKPKLEQNQPITLLTLKIPTYHNTDATRNVDETTNQSNASLEHHHDDEDLLSLLIRDIDETTSIPFFDISLPKEVCMKIFNHLDLQDLCHCACVSKAWSSIANDELLWYNIYNRLGFKDQRRNVSGQVGWKNIVRDAIVRQRLITKNWKERICQIQTFEYEKGGVLTACHLHGDILIIGYANGKTCLWNIESNWQNSLEASPEVHQDPSKASVDCVTVLDNLCATAFSCGVVNIWHTDISVDPIYQYHVNKPANHLALMSTKTPLLLTVSDADIRVDHVNDEGQWQLKHGHTFEDKVSFVETLEDSNESLFALSLRDEIIIYEARRNVFREMDKISGTKITSLGCCNGLLAVGWAPFGFGIGTEFTAKVCIYDITTLRHLNTFLGHHADITCLNLSFVRGLVTGSKDKLVRVYDLRDEEPQVSLRGHSSPITTVQMDSWKVVSGALDGTLKVWDLRMGGVLWETRASHPVRLSYFNTERLVTANIPVDKIPRVNMWYADDLIQHRRHRGTVQLYNFGTEADVVAPEEMRSNYDDISGYNYNINLVAPYDTLTNEIN